jgi:hypothetical protein
MLLLLFFWACFPAHICSDPYQMQQLFMMIDQDRSGRLNEREFAEFWVYTQQSHIPGFGMWR